MIFFSKHFCHPFPPPTPTRLNNGPRYLGCIFNSIKFSMLFARIGMPIREFRTTTIFRV